MDKFNPAAPKLALFNKYPFLKDIFLAIQTALVYFLMTYLVIRLLWQNGYVPILCTANGIGLPVMLNLPRRRWPSVLAGIVIAVPMAYLVSFSMAVPPLWIGLVSAFEVTLAAILLQKYATLPITLESLYQTFQYILIAPVLSCGLSACLGVVIMRWVMNIPIPSNPVTWWAGDAVGMLTIAPVIFILSKNFFWWRGFSLSKKLEGVTLSSLFIAFCYILYISPLPEKNPWLDEYMIFPFLLWAAIRFGVGGSSLIVSTLASLLILPAVFGLGIFSQTLTRYVDRVMTIQLYLLVTSVTTYLLSSVISERDKKTQQNLIQFTAVQSAANSIIVADDKANIIVANPATTLMTGYSNKELIGRNCMELLLVLNPPEVGAGIRENILSGKVWQGNVVSPRKDGSSYIQEMTITPIQDEWGKTKHFVAVMQDISERKKNEQALNESEQFFHAVFDGSAVGITITDQNGNILRTNLAFQKMLGYSEEELEGLPYRQLTHPEDIETNEMARSRVFSGEMDHFQLEKRYIRKDGKPVWARLNATVIRGSKQGPLMIGMAEDITLQRETENNLKWQLEQNQHLLDETHRRARELEAIGEISSALRKAYSQKEMLPILLKQSQVTMSADSVALILLEGKELVFSAEAGPSEALHGVRYEFGRDPIWEMLHKTEPLFITKDNKELLTEHHFARLTMGVMEAGIFAPLHSSMINVGLLFLGYQVQPEAFQDFNSLVVAIAEMAGNALYRSEVMETLERLVSERSKDLQTIYEVSTIANQAKDLDHTLERSLEYILAATHCKSGSIHLVNEVDHVLELAVERNTPPGLRSMIERMPFSEGLQGWIAQNEKSLMIPDISVDNRAMRRDPIEDYSAFLGVPLQFGGKTLGVISVRREGDHPFNIDEIALLGSIADHIGISVENAYLMKRSEEAAVMEERSRLARELHDSVTQSIYSVTLFAEAARQQMADQQSANQVDYLITRVREVAQQALKEMRLLVYELRPPALEQDGLIGGLQQRLDAVEGRVGIHTHLDCVQPLVLPPEQEEALYRITIEALNNILKHAHASEVVIKINATSNRVTLDISDNGNGFDLDGIRNSGGLGLLGMRERVAKMDGELLIDSMIGQGTRISVSAPIQGGSNRHIWRT